MEENNRYTEADVFEAMGVEAPQEQAEEAAEGSEQEQLAETREQEEASEPESGGETDAAGEEKPKQTPEERAVWAARRRQWEARERQAREEAAQARVDQVYADMFKGQVNPFTGKPITTEAEFKAYEAEKTRRAEAEQLQNAGIDPKTIQNMVDQQMAPFRQQMEAARLSAIQETARAANARMEAALQQELKKVSAMDPSIKTLEDIRAMPTAAKFNDYVQKGLGLEDAFYLANRQAVDERRMAAARAATQEKLAGKDHLNPVSGVPGKTPYQVSRAEVEAFRAFMPDATDAEIRAAYEAEMKHRN